MFLPHSCLKRKPLSKKEEDIIKRNILIRLKEFLNDLGEALGQVQGLGELLENSEKLITSPQTTPKKHPSTPTNTQNSSFEEPLREGTDQKESKEDVINDTFDEFLQEAYKEAQSIMRSYVANKIEVPAKLKKLEEELKALTEINKKLEEKNKMLEKTKNKLADQLEESLSTIDVLKKQLFGLERNMSKLIENNMRLDQDKKTVESQLKEKLDKVEVITNELRESVEKNTQKELKLQNLAIEKRELLEILFKTNGEVTQILKEKQELIKKLEEIKGSTQTANGDHLSKINQANQTNEPNKISIAKNEQANEKLTSNEAEMVELTQQIDLYQKRIDQLNQIISNLQDEKILLEEKLQKIESTISVLNTEKEITAVQNQKEIEELKKNLSDLKEQLINANNINSNLQSQNMELSKQLSLKDQNPSAANEALSNNVNNLLKDLESLRLRLKDVEDEQVQTQSINQDLKDQNDSLESKGQALENSCNTLKEEREAILKKLGEKEKELEIMKQMLNETNMKNDKITKILDEKLNVVEETIRLISEKNPADISTDSNNSNSDDDVNSLKKELQDSKEEVEKLKVSNKRMQDFFEDKVVELEESNRSIIAQKLSLKENFDEAEFRIEALNQSLAESQAEIQILQNYNRELKVQFQERVRVLQEENKQSKLDQDSLKCKMQQQELEIEFILDDLNAAKEEISKLKSINKDVKSVLEQKMVEADDTKELMNNEKHNLIMKLVSKEKEIEDFDVILNISKAEIQKLQGVNQELLFTLHEKSKDKEEELDEMQKGKEDLAIKVLENEKDVEDLKWKLQETFKEMSKIRTINRELQLIIEDTVDQIKQIKKNAEEERSIMNLKIEKKEEENSKLKQRLCEIITELTVSKVMSEELEEHFEKKIEGLQEENEEILQEKEILLERLQEKDEELDEMNEKILELQENMNQIIMQNKELEESNEERIREIEETGNFHSNERSDLIDKLNKNNEEIEEIRKALEELQEENIQLRKREEIINEDFDELLRAKEEENENLKTEIDELEVKLEDKDKAMDGLSVLFDHCKVQLEKDMEAKVQASKEDYEEKLKTLQESQAQISEEKQKLQQKLEQYKNEMESLQATLTETRDEMENLQKMTEDLKDKFDENSRKIDDTNIQIIKEKAELMELLEASQKKEQKMKQALGDAVDDNSELKIEIDHLKNEIEYLEEKLQDANDTLNQEKEDLMEELAQLETKAEELQSQMNKAKEDNEKVKAVYHEVNSQKCFLEEKLEETKKMMNSEKEAIMAQLEEAKKQNKELKDLLEANKEELIALKADHQNLNADHSTLQDRLKFVEEAHTDLNTLQTNTLKKLNDVSSEKKDLQAKLIQSQQDVEELEIASKEMKAENSNIADKLKQQEEQTKALVLDKANLQELVNLNEKELKQVRVQIEQSSNLVADLGIMIEQSREKNEKLEKTLNEANSLSESLKDEKENMRIKLILGERQIAILEKSLMEARDRLCQLEQMLHEISVQKKMIDEKFREQDMSRAQLREERDSLINQMNQKSNKLESLVQTLAKEKENTEEKLMIIEDLKTQNSKLLEKIAEVEKAQKTQSNENEKLEVKANLREKEIDFLKANLNDTRSKLMNQSWVVQELRTENLKIIEKLKQTEAISDAIRLEKDNIMVKAHTLKNRLNEVEDQAAEQRNLVEVLKAQKGQSEDDLKRTDMANKTLKFENDILNIKIQSKEEEEKELKNKIAQLLAKLNKIDTINNPQAKTLEYEIKIQLNNIMNLFKGGVKVSKPIQFEKLKALIGMMGLKDSGKSFIVAKLSGEKEAMDLESTECLGFKVSKILQALLIDSMGLEGAMSNVDGIDMQDEMERNATEFVIASYIQAISNAIVMVVNDGSKKEEELINQIVQKNQNKAIIIIHNLKDIQSIEYLKKKLNNRVIKQFNLVRQQIMVDHEPIVFFEQEMKGKKISHLIMAKEGSEAGDVYNDMSVKALKYLMNKEQPQQSMTIQPLKSVESHLRKVLGKILVNSKDEIIIDLPIGVEGDKMISNVDAKLKSFVFDQMGNIKQNLIKNENNIEYTVMRKDENIVSYFNIPMLLEETVQVNVEKLNSENSLLKIKGNKAFEGLLSEAQINREKVLSENMDYSQQFNLTIPLKSKIGEIYSQDQEEMEISYENGVLSISIPVMKEAEVAFELI